MYTCQIFRIFQMSKLYSMHIYRVCIHSNTLYINLYLYKSNFLCVYISHLYLMYTCAICILYLFVYAQDQFIYMYTCQIFCMCAHPSCTECIHIKYTCIPIRSRTICTCICHVFHMFTYQICTQCIHAKYAFV